MSDVASWFVDGCHVSAGKAVYFTYVVPAGSTYKVWTVIGTFLHMFRTVGGNEYIIIDVSSIDDSSEAGGKRTFRIADIPVNTFSIKERSL